MQAICDEIDCRRILWGSDYTGPGGEAFIAYHRGLVDSLKLSDAQRAAVMGGTAGRLWRLSEKERARQ